MVERFHEGYNQMTSGRPSKMKKNLYSWMEMHKRQGVVSARKLGKYMSKKGIVAEKDQHLANDKKKEVGYRLYNRRGNQIAGVILNKKTRRVNFWLIN